jgi:hypothetical protein
MRGATRPLKKLKLNIGYAPCASSNLAVILAVDLAQIVACRRRSGGSQIKSWIVVEYCGLALSGPL